MVVTGLPFTRMVVPFTKPLPRTVIGVLVPFGICVGFAPLTTGAGFNRLNVYEVVTEVFAWSVAVTVTVGLEGIVVGA